MRKIFILLLLAFLFLGCITPVQRLGCCVKENATSETDPGCVLLNMSDYELYDLKPDTLGCNDPDLNLSGLCNVSIDDDFHLIPICTDDKLLECLMPDCKAMVCGDFIYSPRVAPGFTSMDDASGTMPPDADDAGAQIFYKAQCRFLDMDEKMKRIMKNSNSLINVFRIGVGASFDEYDQYRYFFPVSDRFCNINPLISGAGVDRYMNYLQPSLEPFVAETELTEDCIGEGDAPPPFQFSDPTSATKTYNSLVGPEGNTLLFQWSPVNVDTASYSFRHYATLLMNSTPIKEGECSRYIFNEKAAGGLHKKLDKSYYRKMLSIVYAENIFEEGIRAPFECEAGAADCYSGLCDTRFYNRVMLVDMEGDEVNADCVSFMDEGNNPRVVCAPTKGVYLSGEEGEPPLIDYARVTFRPWQFAVETTSYAQSDLVEGMEDPLGDCSDGMGDYHRCRLRGNWDFMVVATAAHTFQYNADEGYIGRERTLSLMPRNIEFFRTEEQDCDDYPDSTSSKEVSCSLVQAAPSNEYQPPLGSIVFFGTGKNNEPVKFVDDTIIGYAIADPSDFDDLLLVENCELSMENIPMPAAPENPTEGEILECAVMCESFCDPFVSVGTQCYDYCRGDVPSPPCFPENFDDPIVNTEDFMRIKLFDPNERPFYWSNLMMPFAPIFEQKVDAVTYTDFADGCGKRVDDGDLVLSSVPWVLAYTKADVIDWGSYNRLSPGYHLSYGPQVLKERNVYDFDTVGELGTSSCDLRFGTPKKVKDDYHAYWLIYPEYIYLFKNNPATNALGQCKVDTSAMLPQGKALGWCEPCTLSTIAYQEVEAANAPYYPAHRTDLNTSNTEPLCDFETETEFTGLFTGIKTDNLLCRDYPADGLSEYGGTVVRSEIVLGGCISELVGGPRTSPEASMMEERLVGYMKSGVLSVIDLEHESNWNRTSTLVGDVTGDDIYFDFQEYDFQRLFGDTGAVIAITKWVDEVDADNSSVVDEIAGRANALRGRCYGCLNAVGIYSESNESFKNAASLLMSDLRLAQSIDVIAFEYEVSDHTYSSTDAFNRSQEVIADIEEYGGYSLENSGKPTIVLPFNVMSGGTWSDEDLEILFREIVKSQDRLVRAGVIGIVYSPVRSSADGKGLVEVSGNVGEPTDKLCALERGLNWLNTAPPTATFNQIIAVQSVNCTKCSSLEKASGLCDITCDNGVECLVPDGEDSQDYRCPENQIPDGIPAPCGLCNETPGTFSCTYRYQNATEEIRTFSHEEITSNAYLDVIGGLKKPQKCCLYESTFNYTYTFMKTTMPSSFSRPIAFSGSGDPNQDCGVSNPLSALDGRTVCGVEVPTQQYDIECEFIPE